MGLKEFRGGSRVFARVGGRPAVAKMIAHLVSGGIPFEFIPLPDARCDILVKAEYKRQLVDALDTFDIVAKTTGTVQEVILETSKVYKYEGVDLHDV